VAVKKRTLAVVPVIAIVLLCSGAVEEPAGKFYAKQVVDQISVNAPENALGRPDGRYAEIKPGGDMTVLMDNVLYFLEGADDGYVVVKAEGAYGLAGLFRMSEEGAPAWLPLAPGSAPGRFKLGTMRFSPVQSTDSIRVVNDGDRPVYLDAVVGIGEDR
jgi:hypothetical protein